MKYIGERDPPLEEARFFEHRFEVIRGFEPTKRLLDLELPSGYHAYQHGRAGVFDHAARGRR
jgi:hypothetical protein